MVWSAAAVFLFAAGIALLSRGGRGSVPVLGAVAAVPAPAIVTAIGARAPIVGWRFPSLAEALLVLLAFHLAVLALTLTARSRAVTTPPVSARGWIFACAALGLVAAALLAVGIARSRGLVDPIALGGAGCTHGRFDDSGSKYEHAFASGGYRVITVSDENPKDIACHLELTPPAGDKRSIPLLSGSSYETPMCAGGQLVMCGDARLLFVEDWSPNPFVPAESRFRGFRLPDLEPFDPTVRGARDLLAPPRPILALAALAILAAGGAIARARRGKDDRRRAVPALAVVAAVLAIPLAIVLAHV
jgi:hypothetical protein